MSPQVSRTLLNTLAVLNDAVFWMVSILPPISNSSSPLSKPMRTVPSPPIISGITVTLMVHNLFLVLWQGPSTCLSFRFLWFSPCFLVFSSFLSINYPSGWYSGRDLVIRFYLKLPENFVRLIIHNGFWFVHILFLCVVKFPFLAQFLMGHLHYLVVSSLVHFLS